MIQIQMILIKPEFKNEFWMRIGNQEPEQISEKKWFKIYNDSFTMDCIEVLGPITKEREQNETN